MRHERGTANDRCRRQCTIGRAICQRLQPAPAFSMAPYKRTHTEVSDEEGNPVIPVGLATTWINLLMHHLRSRSLEHIPTSQLLES